MAEKIMPQTSEIDYSKFKNSLERLREMHEHLLAKSETDIPDIMKEAIQDSVIQRFEVCFDTLWKSVKRYLKEQGKTDIPNSPKQIFRMADNHKIISHTKLKNFIDYTNARVDTSHDYNIEKAKQALEKVGPFIRDATELYKKLTEIK